MPQVPSDFTASLIADSGLQQKRFLVSVLLELDNNYTEGNYLEFPCFEHKKATFQSCIGVLQTYRRSDEHVQDAWFQLYYEIAKHILEEDALNFKQLRACWTLCVDSELPEIIRHNFSTYRGRNGVTRYTEVYALFEYPGVPSEPGVNTIGLINLIRFHLLAITGINIHQDLIFSQARIGRNGRATHCSALFNKISSRSNASNLLKALRGLKAKDVKKLRARTSIQTAISYEFVQFRYDNAKDKKFLQSLRRELNLGHIKMLCNSCSRGITVCECVDNSCGCFSRPSNHRPGVCSRSLNSIFTLSEQHSSISKEGQANRKIPRHVGVEIELTGFSSNECYAQKAYKTLRMEKACIKYDGSLPEEGKEITTSPKAGAYFETSLRTVVETLSSLNGETGNDAGIHMHVDVSDFTRQDMQKLTAMWAKMEPVIMKTVDRRRLSNEYCRPWNIQDSDFATCTDIRNWDDGENIQVRAVGGNRYRSLNLQAYNYDRNTVEFRIMESTLDYGRLISMASIFSNIVESAKKASFDEVRRLFATEERIFNLLPTPVANRIFSQIARN